VEAIGLGEGEGLLQIIIPKNIGEGTRGKQSSTSKTFMLQVILQPD
jgi:hypothetical protein